MTDTWSRGGTAEESGVELSREAAAFHWLLDNFTARSVGVREAVAVSSDGLLMAMSAVRDREDAERLAAVIAGMTGLAYGVAGAYALGALNRVIIDMADGYLLLTAISVGSVLGVIADRGVDLGTVAYEMTRFAASAGPTLTPALIAELKAAVQS
ncbi:dynein regulation protein LC7 [Pilimelia terevasa]|uniref:Dynein regulation protein LC7 n=1 Tax=Pilimelia terevasa TaxID=53372 RepID=A0A8J3BKC8_9ACTN|nr:roadblock/LC7 domain-containing protein [Pilimelia terevasa]GGK17213.1 dynein regulation protein LC7 [Pilimelia terevasa]